MLRQQQEIPVQRSGAFWIAIITIALSIGFIVYSRWPAHRPKGDFACYTDDDGQTWFVGRAFQVVPFDHNGKQTVRAMVYAYDGGAKKFVPYLMRYNQKGQKSLGDAVANAESKNLSLWTLVRAFDADSIQEIKVPGPDHQWVPRSSAVGKAILAGQTPDGSPADMYFP